MRFRTIQIFILCLAIIAMSAFGQHVEADEAMPGAKKAVTKNEHQVMVYYFHGNNRCFTCKKIERLTKEALETYFSSESGTGLIKFSVINTDEPENRQFIEKYRLFTRAVVISDIQNGKEAQWKNLQKIWELVHDEVAFKEYIRNEIKMFIS